MSTLAEKLRESAARCRHSMHSIDPALCDEAAAEIERLHERIAQMRREHNAEIREIERDARAEIRDTVSEERWKAAQSGEYGSY